MKSSWREGLFKRLASRHFQELSRDLSHACCSHSHTAPPPSSLHLCTSETWLEWHTHVAHTWESCGHPSMKHLYPLSTDISDSVYPLSSPPLMAACTNVSTQPTAQFRSRWCLHATKSMQSSPSLRNFPRVLILVKFQCWYDCPWLFLILPSQGSWLSAAAEPSSPSSPLKDKRQNLQPAPESPESCGGEWAGRLVVAGPGTTSHTSSLPPACSSLWPLCPPPRPAGTESACWGQSNTVTSPPVTGWCHPHPHTEWCHPRPHTEWCHTHHHTEWCHPHTEWCHPRPHTGMSPSPSHRVMSPSLSHRGMSPSPSHSDVTLTQWCHLHTEGCHPYTVMSPSHRGVSSSHRVMSPSPSQWCHLHTDGCHPHTEWHPPHPHIHWYSELTLTQRDVTHTQWCHPDTGTPSWLNDISLT